MVPQAVQSTGAGATFSGGACALPLTFESRKCTGGQG